MSRWVVFIHVCCAVALSWAVHGEDRTGPAGSEADALQTIVRDPGHTQVLFLSDGASFKDHLELFDQAFAACRRALRAKPSDTAVRANLGALYLWRDAFHPDESGNFEKAIDQWLIVLNKDSGNESVLAYLQTYEVLDRVQPELADKGMDRIESALRDASKESPAAANLRALARVASFRGDMAEARKAAEALASLAPESTSYLVVGSSDLKTGHADKALSAFQAALKLKNDRLETATAQLGVAQAHLALGDVDRSDAMLTAAEESLSETALDHSARMVGLEGPFKTGWSIGTLYAASGNVEKAFGYLGSEAAATVAHNACIASDAGNKPKAVDLFLAVLQLESDEAVAATQAVGLISFDLEHYADAVWSLQQARDMGADLSENSLIKLGVSHLVLGEYQKAYDEFDKAHRKAPNDTNARKWRIGAAFGVGGWKMALDTLTGAPPLDLDANPNSPRLRTYEIVYGVFTDADQRAKRARLRYPRLSHLSALNELLSTVVDWSFGNLDRTALRKEKWTVLWEAIDLYRALPLKPVPPKRAVDQEAMAGELIRKGNTQGYEAESAAIAATQIAPWWPEARYNLGVLARDSDSWSDRHLYEPDGIMLSGNARRDAAEEFRFYLQLAPQGKQADNVREQLKKWGYALPAR